MSGYTFITSKWPICQKTTSYSGIIPSKFSIFSKIDPSSIFTSGIYEEAFEICVESEKSEQIIQQIKSICPSSNIEFIIKNFSEKVMRTPGTFPIQVI